MIANEWRKYTGLTEINAKYRYVQYCRSLKTFGITLFTIKVTNSRKFLPTKMQQRKKDSKKVEPKLLGFTRDAIIRMDVDCKVTPFKKHL